MPNISYTYIISTFKPDPFTNGIRIRLSTDRLLTTTIQYEQVLDFGGGDTENIYAHPYVPFKGYISYLIGSTLTVQLAYSTDNFVTLTNCGGDYTSTSDTFYGFTTASVDKIFAISDSCIVKSLDGGVTFNIVDTITAINPTATGGFYSIYFLNDYKGYVGLQDKLYFTSNLGSTWTEVTSLVVEPGDSITSIAVGNDGNTIIASGLLAFYKSLDGGVTWASTLFTDASLEASAVQKYSDSIYYIARRTNSFTNEVFKTIDGGNTFTSVMSDPIDPGALTNSITYVNFYDDQDAIILQKNVQLYITTDGGSTYTGDSIYGKLDSVSVVQFNCDACPEGYVQDGDNCVQTITTPATYSLPEFIEIIQGDQNSGAYGKWGLNLFQTVFPGSVPLVGGGTGQTSNAFYKVRTSNGTGPNALRELAYSPNVYTGPSPIMNTLWKQRLNNVGVWAADYPECNPNSPSQCYCLSINGGTECDLFSGMILTQTGFLNGKPFFEGITPNLCEQEIAIYYNSELSRWEASLNGVFIGTYLETTGSCPIGGPWEGDILSITLSQTTTNCTPPSIECIPITFSWCVEASTTKTYLVGMAGDNEVRLKIDGIPYVRLTAQTSAVTTPFNYWHVFPIELSAGQHTITLEGYNYDGDASFGAEIYDISIADFKTQFCDAPNPTPAQLEPYILFSTKDTIGTFIPDPYQEGYPGVWECLDGSEVSTCFGTPVCSYTQIIPLIKCYYELVSCTNIENVIYTSTDVSDYIGLVVKLDDDTCWSVIGQTDVYEDPEDIVVQSSHESCPYCLPSYKLVNCKDNTATIYTNVDLSEYTRPSKTIQVQEYPGECWQVGINDKTEFVVEEVTVDGDPFTSCVACNPVIYQLNNCYNNSSFILSDTDLADVVGKVISIVGYPGLCFSVGEPTCDCIKLIGNLGNGQFTLEVQASGVIVGGRNQYFFTNGGDEYVLVWNEEEARWEIINVTADILIGYSPLDIDCPYSGYWIDIPDFIVESCSTVLYDITIDKVYPECECCITKSCE